MAAIAHIPAPQAPGARPNGSPATLQRPERGFVYGGPQLIPVMLHAGTQVIIFSSERSSVQPWPDALQAGVQREYRYRVQADTTELFSIFTEIGNLVDTRKNGGLIPHSALSDTKGGKPLDRTDWKKDDIAYLLKTHSYIDTGGVSASIPWGEPIRLMSDPRTLRSPFTTTSLPSKAYYAFQRVEETRITRLGFQLIRYMRLISDSKQY
ncbi:hypothetical protein CPB84DRAFT_1842992 [Gymnopilus junonius]|uniref:Uncharacterized protein n=1 Tax=Gymnopilus junonius TaxID=109634 RepID=A0A9P5TS17_GYMJU|nr:hypothetical protein CPB84DRAFT_1842992 [Gymnopilus junonius]